MSKSVTIGVRPPPSWGGGRKKNYPPYGFGPCHLHTMTLAPWGGGGSPDFAFAPPMMRSSPPIMVCCPPMMEWKSHHHGGGGSTPKITPCMGGGGKRKIFSPPHVELSPPPIMVWNHGIFTPSWGGQPILRSSPPHHGVIFTKSWCARMGGAKAILKNPHYCICPPPPPYGGSAPPHNDIVSPPPPPPWWGGLSDYPPHDFVTWCEIPPLRFFLWGGPDPRPPPLWGGLTPMV